MDQTGTITPHLTVKNANQAIEFYRKAFGAEELYRLPAEDGKVAHAALKIGNAVIWLADELPAYGNVAAPGGTALNLHVADADQTFERATKAGATTVQPVTEMFWGARYGRLKDPFGNQWSISQQVKEVPVDAMLK